MMTAPDLQGVKVTESFVADLFVKRYGEQFCYDHERGYWFEYDGSVWRMCKTPVAFDKMHHLVREIAAVGKLEASLEKVRFVKGAAEFARSSKKMGRTSESWNREPFLLGTPDGTVDLRTGRKRDSMPGDNINRATAIAPALTADCPRWIEFLMQSAADEETIRFLQQICGYALTGDTREQALFFIYGDGGNGKGVFLNTISRIMGDYAATATMEAFTMGKSSSSGPTPEIAMLAGARLVSASETEEGKPWAEARLKALTGGDPITARFNRQDHFTFQPLFKLVIIGNHQPTLNTVDEAMRRRFNMIPFTRQPAQKDPELESKLAQEWPGILRWMIDGCLDWQASGLIRPDSVEKATQDYFEDQNTLEDWLSSHCEVKKDNRHLTVKSSAAFSSWSNFARAAGENPGSNKSFTQTMLKNGFHKSKDMHGRWFHGVQLIDNTSQVHDA